MMRVWSLVLPVAAGFVTTLPAEAKGCSGNGDLPPGVRLPERPGCPSRPGSSARDTKPAVKAGRQPGFIDLGNGAELRIGGQVDAEALRRR
jgi:hypothetical protein